MTSVRTRWLVWAITAAGAAIAAGAPARPSGVRVADALWCAAFATIVSLAMSRARRWSWLWCSGIATAGAVGSPWVVAGAAALGLAIGGAFLDRRNRVLGAAIGALAAQSLLRFPAFGFHGMPSLVASVAIAPALWSAYDRSRRSQQRRIRRVVLAGVLAIGIVLLGLAIGAVTARNELERGVGNSQDALQLIRDGHPEEATDRFQRAQSAFAAAQGSLDAVWALPARALPFVGPQLHALTGVADTGDDLSRTAATATSTGRYQDLRSAAGRIDLTRVEAMQQPVAASADALVRARSDIEAVDSSWLVPPIADRLDRMAQKIDDTIPEAELASEGLRVAPRLLGADGTRRYLVLFTTPAESRFAGGFTGSYGVLTADHGKVSLTESGPISELAYAPGARQRTLDGFDDVLARYSRYNPALFLQNLTVSPDFPTDAAMARQLFPQATGQQIDGVMLADPYALAAFLQLTGPVTVEGLDTPLTGDTAADYLLRQQYLQFAASDDDRRDQLATASRATFDALTERDLPGPRALGDALGPVMREKRLLFWTFDPAEQQFLDHLGTSGRFAPVPGGDYLSVRSANANPSKIDTFLQRDIAYDVQYDPSTGAVDGRVTIELDNAAPASGLPPYVIGNDRGDPPGSNTMYLSVYSPLRLREASLDGRPVGIEPQREFGGPVYSLLVTVPPGGRVRLELALTGEIPPGPAYRLDVLSQPTVNPDRFRLSTGRGTADESLTLSTDTSLVRRFDGGAG